MARKLTQNGEDNFNFAVNITFFDSTVAFFPELVTMESSGEFIFAEFDPGFVPEISGLVLAAKKIREV